MQAAADVLEELGVGYEMNVVSAHRTPKRMAEYAETARERGLKVIVAGAGGAAHLPGMTAAHTPLPVIGVPVKLKSLEGLDSLLSIAQMPGGVPVATVAINQAKNAGILAAQIVAASDEALMDRIADYKKRLEAESLRKNEKLDEARKSRNL
jgi:5-(carboxyamino)imidazole ribonucleotide mutase